MPGTIALQPTHTPDQSAVQQDRPAEGRAFSVADLCRRWKVGADKVHAFIRRGELVAVNVAANLSGRPQWRITPESVAWFERKRCSAPPLRPSRRRRPPATADYYPD